MNVLWFLENKDEDKTAIGMLRGPEHSRYQNIQADTQGQPIWGNGSDGNPIRSKYVENSKATVPFYF